MKKKNRSLLVILAVLLLASGLVLVSCQKKTDVSAERQLAEKQGSGEREILYYTCGMHPTVRVTVEDHEAGNDGCPICKMDLVPVYKEDTMSQEGEQAASGEMAPQIKLSARAQALAKVQTEEIGFLPLFKEIDAVGQMVWDERKVAYVAAWVPGRLDKLYVNFTGLEVQKGSELALLYSPKLLTTQEEYLLALETLERVSQSPDKDTIRNAEALVVAAEKRLRLWGISEKQIGKLAETRTSQTHLVIHAPIGGTVIEKHAVEGKYVKEGENLFQIASTDHLWMEADIYEHELAHIQEGQPVSIKAEAFSGETFKGNIVFIEPALDPKTRSVKVRVDVPNPMRRLRPGMYVNALIRVNVFDGISAPTEDVYICTMCPEVKSDKPGQCPECGMDLVKKEASAQGGILAVPKEAVLDTGERALVYVEHEPGSYMAHEIELGSEAVALVDGQKRRFYAVLAGLEDGMRVVSRANFLIDSQSQITGQAEAIYSGALDREEGKKPPSKHIH